MLERHALLKDRLRACAVFSGIAIAAVAGFELVITGNLDSITPPAMAEAPSRYDPDTVLRAWRYQPHVRVSYTPESPQYAGYPDQPLPADAALAGGPNDPGAPDGAAPTERTEAELYAEIDRLMREGAAPSRYDEMAQYEADVGEAPTYEDPAPLANEDAPALTSPNMKDAISAYESASPS